MSRLRAVLLLSRAMQRRVFDATALARIAAATDLVEASADTFTEADQTAAMRGAGIVITGWGTHAITTAMLDTAPDLKLMCHSAGSIKHLVTGAFGERGIRVCSAASALAVGVAEFAFGMMLVSMKRAWDYRDATHRGEWDASAALDRVR